MNNLTTVTPTIKSFWKRPEGKVGAFFLLPIIGFSVYYLGLAMPFIVGLLSNTLIAIFLIVGIIISSLIFLNKKTWLALSLGYQLIMRKLTGFIITIDPIGILKNEIQKLRNRSEQYEEDMGSLKGDIDQLKTTIEKNNQQINESLKLASYARKNSDKTDVVSLETRKAGRRTNSNEKFQKLLNKSQSYYDQLSRYKKHADVMIEDKSDLVEQMSKEYKIIKSTHSAWKSAKSILTQTPDERALFDQTVEYMTMEVSSQIGEMDRFQENLKTFLDSADLQNGVYQEDGLKMLDSFENKNEITSTPENVQNSNWNNLLK